MGTVHRFPSERVRGVLYPAPREKAADILILPVVRIERDDALLVDSAEPRFSSHPPNNNGTGRRRRRSRS